MHGGIVPTEEKLPASERAIRFLPPVQIDHARQYLVELWKAPGEQDAHINALRVIIQFPPIHSHARPPGERLRQSLFIKKIFNVVINSALDCLRAIRILCNGLDLCQRLKHKARMKMIYESSYFIRGV